MFIFIVIIIFFIISVVIIAITFILINIIITIIIIIIYIFEERNISANFLHSVSFVMNDFLDFKLKETVHRRRFLLDIVFILIVLQAVPIILVYPSIAIQFPSATTILPPILSGLY